MFLNRKRPPKYGQLASSFGRWLWWQGRGDGLRSISFDSLELRALFERAAEFGMRISDPKMAWIRLSVPMAGGERASKDLCTLISRMVDAEDEFISQHMGAVFDLAQGRQWMSCLDWFRIHSPEFEFSKLDYPSPGIRLEMPNQGRGANAFEDGYAAAFAIADVRSVSGQGDTWHIALENGDRVLMHHTRGLRIDRA